MNEQDTKNCKRGRPQRYVLWKDWERWVLLEWTPFRTNDFEHLKEDVSDLKDMKTDVTWLKGLMIGLIIVIIGGAIAVILS